MTQDNGRRLLLRSLRDGGPQGYAALARAIRCTPQTVANYVRGHPWFRVERGEIVRGQFGPAPVAVHATDEGLAALADGTPVLDRPEQKYPPPRAQSGGIAGPPSKLEALPLSPPPRAQSGGMPLDACSAVEPWMNEWAEAVEMLWKLGVPFDVEKDRLTDGILRLAERNIPRVVPDLCGQSQEVAGERHEQADPGLIARTAGPREVGPGQGHQEIPGETSGRSGGVEDADPAMGP